MDEQSFRLLADDTFRHILDGFDSIDSDDADVETAGNTITITFRSGAKCVINTQATTRQLWLAGGKSAWHFSYDADSSRWLHDKGTGDELFQVLAKLAQDEIGSAPKFP